MVLPLRVFSAIYSVSLLSLTPRILSILYNLFQYYTVFNYRKYFLGWRDDSEVKSTCYSQRTRVQIPALPTMSAPALGQKDHRKTQVIYIMIHNSSRITQNNFTVGRHHYMQNCIKDCIIRKCENRWSRGTNTLACPP